MVEYYADVAGCVEHTYDVYRPWRGEVEDKEVPESGNRDHSHTGEARVPVVARAAHPRHAGNVIEGRRKCIDETMRGLGSLPGDEDDMPVDIPIRRGGNSYPASHERFVRRGVTAGRFFLSQ